MLKGTVTVVKALAHSSQVIGVENHPEPGPSESPNPGLPSYLLISKVMPRILYFTL